MKGTVPTIDEIKIKIAPLALKYGVESIYVFGSYARGEATDSSDIDILVFGGSGFKKSLIYALSEELREIMKKDIDIFEISEINVDSDFYSKVMDEKVLVA
ncbi:MAG: nucleotidyltransferase domain-containing protein [Saccharofermentans sp.]|nr:nucleotidyltransferase domain-containing protein [Clostridiales bacterium]MCR5383787.1 nucleotidyltransferase domain-containing protein [Saccharofermentans sp.]